MEDVAKVFFTTGHLNLDSLGLLVIHILKNESVVTSSTSSNQKVIGMFKYIVTFFVSFCFSAAFAGKVYTLDKEARIVINPAPSPSVRLASTELQYFIRKATGLQIPIVTVCPDNANKVIFVGQSAYTDRYGISETDLGEQEYLIDVSPQRIILMGKDTDVTSQAIRDKGRSNNGFSPEEDRKEINYQQATDNAGVVSQLTLPSIFDPQGTCYAVYDFIERCLGVRFYGPHPDNIVIPKIKRLKIEKLRVRRAPAIKYRDGSLTFGWPFMKEQFMNATEDMLQLYMRRMRMGGRRWAANHAFTGFQDRFLKQNPVRPELFEGNHPEYFAVGWGGGASERQFCYTNPAFIHQVAKDAIHYFEGKGTVAEQVALGDYFAIVPLDNANWCTCEECQKLLALDKDNIVGRHFNCGTATHYIWNFVNKVAREVKRQAPDKKLAALAYHVYAYLPEDIKLEDNIAVAPCLHTRNYWAPGMKRNEMKFYKDWVEESKVSGRDIFVWSYLGFPTERGLVTDFHVFPGFNAHATGEQMRMFAADGVKGVYLCGLSEQVDFYLTMKLFDDPSLDTDQILNEFFDSYFGKAAGPMKNFYLKIESVYSNPLNYPSSIQTQDAQFHQTRELAWKYLGTPEVMEELERYMEEAASAAKESEEKGRVDSWKLGIWDYMVAGFKDGYQD